MKKKLFLKFFVLAVIGAFVTFTSCKDYDDDINDLSKKIGDLKTQLDGINSKIEGGAVITKVEQGTSGLKITLSNGQSYDVTNGKDGVNGKDGKDGVNGKNGSVVTIGENGNWFIDGEDTGKAAKGEKGDAGEAGADGKPGADGKDGKYYVPNKDGYWHVVENGEDTATTDKWLPEGTLTAVWDADLGIVKLYNVDGVEGEYILGANVLTSLVHEAYLYVGGTRAIAFRPLVLNTWREDGDGDGEQPTLPGCPLPEITVPGVEVPCLDNVGETVVVDGFGMQIVAPGSNKVVYKMNPSNVKADMMDLSNLEITSHMAMFRTGGVEDDMPNPYSAKFVNIEKGRLIVDMELDLAKYAEAYGLEGYFGWGPVPGFGYKWTVPNPVTYLQVPHSQAALNKLPAGIDPYVTSNEARTVVQPIVGVDIAKKKTDQYDECYAEGDLLSDYLGKPATGATDVAGVPAGSDNAKAQIDGVNNGTPADYRIIELVEGEKINLVDYVTAVGENWYGDEDCEMINYDPTDYGLTWSFDMLDGNDKVIKYELTTLKTDQQKFLKVLDEAKGTIEAQVYGDTPTGAAVDRTPIVRVRIMSGDCVVSQAFIKILIVKKGVVTDVKDLGTFTADSNVACDDAEHMMTVEQVNRNIYNKLNLSKEEFHAIYGEGSMDNVEIEHLGTFDWTVDTDDTGRSTYLPTWTIGSCDCPWGEEMQKPITTVVYIKPLVKGHPVLKLTYKVVLKKPSINFTNADLQIAYWDETYSFVQHHTAKPVVGDANPANNTFANNINAAFKTHANKLLKLGEGFVDYEYVFAPVAEQIKKDVNGVAITVRISNDGKELYAKYNADFDGYTKGTEQLIAKITDHTATDITNPNGEDLLTYQETVLAKFLLNQKTDFMWAKLNIISVCECFPMNITINGKEGFYVHFLRPVNLNPTASDKYIDGLDFGKRGTFLDIYKLSGLQDWRTDKFKDNANYVGFYGVQSITLADAPLVKWDANGSIEPIPSTLEVKWHTLAQVQAIDAGNTGAKLINNTTDKYEFGGVSYNNNGTAVTNDFYLYIPIKVTYKWGTIISETVKVKVEKTTVAP